MPESTPIHSKKRHSSIIPQIEKLLTEQTSVILQAVNDKLSGQDKGIEEGFAAQDKRMEERFMKSESWLPSTNAWQRRKNALSRVWMN
jgi:hypothetical protein